MLKEQIKRESPVARVDSDTTEVAGCGSDVVGEMDPNVWTAKGVV